ncbi:hypothetical protein V5799_033394, partial [Amblyomma americanum]
MSSQPNGQFYGGGNDNRDRLLFRFSRPMVVRAVILLVATTLLLVILALALVVRRTSAESSSRPLPFCCPYEGNQLTAIVNDTMKPCNNLYAHVCAAVIQNGSGKSEMLLRNLQEMIAGLPVTPADRFASSPSVLTDSRAGVFLQGLYSSCVAASKAKPHQDQDGRNVPAHFVQMAAALWDIGRELLANLTEPNFLVFLFIMNLKYQIRSVVEIQYSSSDGTLLFYHDALKLSSEMHLVCRECVAAAVNAYNRTEGTSRPANGGGHQQQVNTSYLMFSHVAEFAENLHMLYPERGVVERFVIANISQLWPTEQFAKALSILSWVNSVAD